MGLGPTYMANIRQEMLLLYGYTKPIDGEWYKRKPDLVLTGFENPKYREVGHSFEPAPQAVLDEIDLTIERYYGVLDELEPCGAIDVALFLYNRRTGSDVSLVERLCCAHRDLAGLYSAVDERDKKIDKLTRQINHMQSEYISREEYYGLKELYTDIIRDAYLALDGPQPITTCRDVLDPRHEWGT